MAANHGGARPGAGRKPKADLFATPIRRAEKRIADRLPFLVDKLMELSEGVLVEGTRMDGSPYVYRTPPDRQAATYLVDRIMGKPAQSVDIGNKDGEPFEVAVRSRDYREGLGPFLPPDDATDG